MYEYNAEHALEITVGDTKVAWTDDDEVYVHQPDHLRCWREDGYVLIGVLGWEDSEGDSHDGNMAYNIERLREFVLEVMK